MDYKKVEDKYKEWANILKALAHPIRLYIVELLSKGEKCVCEIDEQLHIDISTVSRHLATLRRAGLIKDDRRGNQVFYSLQIPCVMNFFKCSDEVVMENLKSRLKVLKK